MRGTAIRSALAGAEEVMNAGTGETQDRVIPQIREASWFKQISFTQFIIYLVGFSEGLTHLAALAIYYMMKDDLGLSPAQVSGIFIAPALPWVFKPAFAFISDTYPIYGSRRKPYMVLFSFLEGVGFLMLGTFPTHIFTAVISLFVISLSASICSAVAEALVVETTAGKSLDQSAENVSDFITAKAIGSLIVAYLSGYLLEQTSKQSIFIITALFPFIITCVTLFMEDITAPTGQDLKTQVKQLVDFLKQSVIYGPALYIFFYMAGPDYDDAIFFYFTNKLGFSPSFMGTLRFTYGIAALVGVVLYRNFFKGTGFRKTLTYTILIALPIYISPIILVSGLNSKLGISNQAFVLSGGFLIEATAEIQLLPLLVLTASICPPGLEGSVYATMMSVRNTGSMVSRGVSALFTYLAGITASNFNHLGAYILFCGGCLLIPLMFIESIPDDSEIQKVKQYHDSLYEKIRQQNA